ncbi:MAG: ABC transporter permease [Alphaproteobacteria bacterium]
MLGYILRRVLYTVPIAIGVTVVCFALVYLGPSDPISAILPEDAPKELIERIKKEYGFDKPLPIQYLTWLGKAATGDLGMSIATRRMVIEEIPTALANSLLLAVLASTLAFSLGTLLGAIAGYWYGRAVDRAVTAVAVVGVSVPHYWLAIVLVIIFSVELDVLPSMGMGPDGSTNFSLTAENLRHLVLPTIALSLIPTAIVARTVRESVRETLAQEYVQALRAKGLTERAVLRHVAKNAAPTVLAVMGLQLGYLLGGSILVETVFAWPGTGLLLNNSIFSRDIPMLQGVILVLALFFVTLNLVVDILQAALDPRIKR